MANFTPQEIEQFLQQFFDVVGARQYVGARYVPIFGRAGSDTVEWDDLAPYEPLTVVMHDGVSYVSRRYVPAGIAITDTEYWVQTYRFNAQVEQYRQEVLGFQSQIDGIRADLESDYVPFPDQLVLPKYGTLGQVLTTLANGETKWEDPVVPSDEQAEEVITSWLDDHPEATTTVQDNSITDAKLAPDGILKSFADFQDYITGYSNGATVYNELSELTPVIDGYQISSAGTFSPNSSFMIFVFPVRHYNKTYNFLIGSSNGSSYITATFRMVAFDANFNKIDEQSKYVNDDNTLFSFTDTNVKYFAVHIRKSLFARMNDAIMTVYVPANTTLPNNTAYLDRTTALKAIESTSATNAINAQKSINATFATNSDNAGCGTPINGEMIGYFPNYAGSAISPDDCFTITDGLVTYIDNYTSEPHFSTLVYELGARSEIEGKTIYFRRANNHDILIGITKAYNGSWGPAAKHSQIFNAVATSDAVDKFTISTDFLDTHGYSDADGTLYLTFRFNINENAPYAWNVKLNISISDKNPFNISVANEITDTLKDSIIADVSLNPLLNGKTWAAYGDSITAISNGNGLDLGWASYVNENLDFDYFYGRGVGGQKYAWGTNGGAATFVYSDGRYHSRDNNHSKDDYSGTVPEGTTLIRGCFCSWDRITHMFPASIKNSIDIVFIMGGTNDSNDSTAEEFVTNSTADPEWAASSYYSTYGGDYNISTLKGGMASCVMKMQAWMPQAIIVIGTQLSGVGTAGEIGTVLDSPSYQKSRMEYEMGLKMSCPVIDVYASCGINPWNRVSYIEDGVHPYLEAGKMMLGRAVLMGFVTLAPMLQLHS